MSMVSSLPSPPPPPSPLFSNITEQDNVLQQEEVTPYKHHSTPTEKKKKKPPRSDDMSTTCPVSFNKCRPSSRDKTTIVPVDHALKHRHTPSTYLSTPNALRSLFLSITAKSPCAPSSSPAAAAAARDDDWRLAAADLPRKLAHATRKREEALLETSRLKHSVSDLELKLSALESYCHTLRAAIDQPPPAAAAAAPPPPLAVESFLRAVSDARAAARQLGRALVSQIRHGAGGPRAVDRVSALVQAGDVRVLGGQALLLCMEALLNRVFYREFEAAEEAEPPLDPAGRCEASRAAVEAVRGVGWEEVLSKGTRHYSEGLSRCCDRWMSEVVGALGWSRAWPEPLLQAFFGAAKGAWVVRLMARSVEPTVPILRVDRGARFDPGYMDNAAAGGGGERRSSPAEVGVRVLVAPGFYVYSGGTCGVVKCRVLCVYGGGSGSSGHTVTADTSSSV